MLFWWWFCFPLKQRNGNYINDIACYSPRCLCFPHKQDNDEYHNLKVIADKLEELEAAIKTKDENPRNSRHRKVGLSDNIRSSIVVFKKNTMIPNLSNLHPMTYAVLDCN